MSGSFKSNVAYVLTAINTQKDTSFAAVGNSPAVTYAHTVLRITEQCNDGCIQAAALIGLTNEGNELSMNYASHVLQNAPPQRLLTRTHTRALHVDKD